MRPEASQLAGIETRLPSLQLTGSGVCRLSSESQRPVQGGYAVIFWSRSASNSEWVKHEIELAADGMAGFNDRVLFGLLEPCPLPAFWLQFNEPSVQLFGDAGRTKTQRLDDLVVRFYWLMYRKTKVCDA